MIGIGIFDGVSMHARRARIMKQRVMDSIPNAWGHSYAHGMQGMAWGTSGRARTADERGTEGHVCRT